jgi:hypothetical protein
MTAIWLNQGFDIHVSGEPEARQIVIWFGFRPDSDNLHGGANPCDLKSCGSFYLTDLAPAGVEPERKSKTMRPAERLQSACLEVSVRAEVVSWSGVQLVAFLPLDSGPPTFKLSMFHCMMSQAVTTGFSGFASVLFLSPPAWASQHLPSASLRPSDAAVDDHFTMDVTMDGVNGTVLFSSPSPPLPSSEIRRRPPQGDGRRPLERPAPRPASCCRRPPSRRAAGDDLEYGGVRPMAA